MLAQHADHHANGFLRARIGKSFLRSGKIDLRSTPCTEESRDQCRRTRRIQQAESDQLEKGASFLNGANGLSIQPPFFPAKFVQLEISHIGRLNQWKKSGHSSY